MDLNWEAIGAIGEILGALTVIVTLFFLFGQLRLNSRQLLQANELARADSQRDILKQVADHSTLTIAKPDLQQDIRTCYQSWIDAPAAAKWNFECWASAYFYIVEQAINMHESGLLSDETYDAMEIAAIRMIETPGGNQWWEKKSKNIGAQVSRKLNERREALGTSTRPMMGLRTNQATNDA
jgi:hypothetical protein